MDLVHKQKIQSAVDEVLNGSTQRAAAKRWQVAQSTLSTRLHGAVSKSKAKLAPRRLSPEEEGFLVDWCLNKEGDGRPPSKAQITRINVGGVERCWRFPASWPTMG